MYHRVAKVECDPWELAVRPDLFAQQIEALTRERCVVPLRWLGARLSEGRPPRKAVVVTFDDGYSDVLTNAKPVLERFSCPATVFLTTGAIGSSEEFWWDELPRVILQTSVLPAELEIEVAGRMHRWRLVESIEDPDSEPADEEARATRQQLHLALWGLLKPLDADSRRRVLDKLSTWAAVDGDSFPASRALDAGEVRRLADRGFIDIGAHTVTHPSMPLLDPVRRREEVVDSRRDCEELTGSKIEAFAYPFGDLDDDSVSTVREAGFSIACSTKYAAITSRADLLRLPRFAVSNWDATELMRRFPGER